MECTIDPARLELVGYILSGAVVLLLLFVVLFALAATLSKSNSYVDEALTLGTARENPYLHMRVKERGMAQGGLLAVMIWFGILVFGALEYLLA